MHSLHEVSRPEPFELVRPPRHARDTFESWYERARMTLRSLVTLESAPDVVVVRAPGEMKPAVAGGITGAVGGVVMLAVATLLARRYGHPLDVASVLGGALSGERLFGTPAFVAGLGVALTVGAVIGAFFGWITRRLRHLAPLMIFGLVLATATWMVVQLFVMPRIVPWLAHVLPFGPMMVASAVFGLVLSLALPLRRRRMA
jgi:hypothetical protein